MSEPSLENQLLSFLELNNFDSEIGELRPHLSFPSDELLSLYLDGVGDRHESEVKDLLWRMLSSTTSTMDGLSFSAIVRAANQNPAIPPEVLDGGSIKRLRWRDKTGIGDAWEGVTWTIEMLPYKPGRAIEALELYLEAQHGLPDDRISAVADAIDIIRARWIGSATSAERLAVLSGVGPRTFEALVGALWVEMGYSVTLTPPTVDGGYDLRAIRNMTGGRQSVLIECKRYAGPVGVDIIRKLVGVLEGDRDAVTALVVTNSTFTRHAVRFASILPAVDLIEGPSLVLLLNKHLGFDWPSRIGRITGSLLARGAESPISWNSTSEAT